MGYELELEILLETIHVVERDADCSEHDSWPEGLPYGVYDDNECIALFTQEDAALYYRLMVINQRINLGWCGKILTAQ